MTSTRAYHVQSATNLTKLVLAVQMFFICAHDETMSSIRQLTSSHVL